MLAEFVLPSEAEGDDQRVDDRQRRGHRVHERGHVRPRGQADAARRVDRGHRAVGQADDLRAARLREAHRFKRARRIAREADAKEQIALVDAADLFKHVAARLGNHAHVVKDKVEVIREELRNRRSRAQTHHIDVARADDFINHLVKRGGVNFLGRRADILHIGMQHRAQHLALVDIRRHFKALHRRQPVAHELLKRPLQLRIALIPHRRGKANDGRFAHADLLAQLAGRHKNGLVVVLHNIFRNLAMTLAQSFAGLIESAHHVLHILHNV